MEVKTCCITGHRKIDKTKLEETKEAIRKKVLEAIEDGYTHFVSGFAEGVDLYFATIVAELKEEYDITLEAALPYNQRLYTRNQEFQRLLSRCDVVQIHSERYTKACFMIRNRFMVCASSLVIAVYDGRETGGTAFTVDYANRLGKEVYMIRV